MKNRIYILKESMLARKDLKYESRLIKKMNYIFRDIIGFVYILIAIERCCSNSK